MGLFDGIDSPDSREDSGDVADRVAGDQATATDPGTEDQPSPIEPQLAPSAATPASGCASCPPASAPAQLSVPDTAENTAAPPIDAATAGRGGYRNKPQLKGQWSKHSSARLAHALDECQAALATVAHGQSRPQLDAGENPYDQLAAKWNDQDWKPEQDAHVLASLGRRHCPDPRKGICGPRAAAEIKSKLHELKADFARYATLPDLWFLFDFLRCLCPLHMHKS